MTPQRRANLDRLLSPRTIAFVGGRDAEVAVKEARRAGFGGIMRAVNPKREALGGVLRHRSIADLPEVPDAVFLAVPAPAAVKATVELRIGAGGIVCYTAGFREAGGDGAALEQALVAAAGDMALVGPNCYGVINYLDRVALWPFAHGGATRGWGAAIVTQSGMLSSDITMAQRSLPLTHMISGGNQAVLTIEDFVDYLAGHEKVRAIGIHIEGLRTIGTFEAAALRALERGVPVVALKTGSSRVGASLTVSHTGSLSGADDLYDALFSRCGVIRVRSPSELVETLKLMTICGAPKGNRVMGFTCSGGGATMLADHAEMIGLDFPPFDVAGKAELTELLPPIATVSNPLDYTTPIWGNGALTRPVFERAMALSAADQSVLVQDYPAPGLDESKPFYLADAKAFVAAAKATGIPAAIAATLPENLDAETREMLVDEGIAPLQGINEALNAMRAAALWSEARERRTSERAGALFAPRAAGRLRMLDEAAGKRRLSALGVRVPEGLLVAGADVVAAGERLGYPVVLKMMGPRLAHKSEAGAVAVGIGDGDGLAAAVAQMRQAVRAHDPQAVTDSFLIERMLQWPLAELIVSVRADAQFGMALMIGSGGVPTELVGDSVTLLLPATEAEIGRKLATLKVSRLLAGFRGAAGADRAAIGRLIARLAEAVAGARDSVAELEINPLFVYEADIVAVDVLMHEWLEV